MMNAMHPGRHNDQIQNPFELNRQTPVGMMKKRRGLECDKKDYQHDGRDTKQRHRKREKADGKNHFAEMKSRGGADIEIEIGVMHVMKPPEDWDHMIGPMPPPVSVIHQQKGGDHSGPAG